MSDCAEANALAVIGDNRIVWVSIVAGFLVAAGFGLQTIVLIMAAGSPIAAAAVMLQSFAFKDACEGLVLKHIRCKPLHAQDQRQRPSAFIQTSLRECPYASAYLGKPKTGAQTLAAQSKPTSSPRSPQSIKPISRLKHR